MHRIDKDTSGLLIIAKNEDAKTHLGKQYFNKTTKRLYNALVWGNFTEDEGTITGDLGRDPRDRMLFTVFPEGENPNAKHAVTHYRVMERLRGAAMTATDLRGGAAMLIAALSAEDMSTVAMAEHIDRGYENVEEAFGQLGVRLYRA